MLLVRPELWNCLSCVSLFGDQRHDQSRRAQSKSELICQSLDHADIQMAGAGDICLFELIDKVFLALLPVETKALLQGSTDQPLLEQALWSATYWWSWRGLL